MPDEIKGTDAVSASPDADSLFYLLKITGRAEIGNRDADGTVKEFFDPDDIGVMQSTVLLQDFNDQEFIELQGQFNDKWVNGDGDWGGLNGGLLLIPAANGAPEFRATWTVGANDRETELNAANSILIAYDSEAVPGIKFNDPNVFSFFGAKIKNQLSSSHNDFFTATDAISLSAVFQKLIDGVSFVNFPGSNSKFLGNNTSNVIQALNKIYGEDTEKQKEAINSPLNNFFIVKDFVNTQVNRTEAIFGPVFNSENNFWNTYKDLTNTSNLTDGVKQNFISIEQITGTISTGISFTDLSDTPTGFESGKFLVANETGLEWTGISFTGLPDTPTGYDNGKILQSTADGLEWVDMPVGGGGGGSSDNAIIQQGTYTGNSEANNAEQTINLGFTPVRVEIFGRNDHKPHAIMLKDKPDTYFSWRAIDGTHDQFRTSSLTSIIIQDGFKVANGANANASQLNWNGEEFDYYATADAGGGGSSSTPQFSRAQVSSSSRIGHSEADVDLDASQLATDSENWIHTNTTRNTVGILVPEDGLYDISFNIRPVTNTNWKTNVSQLSTTLRVVKADGTDVIIQETRVTKSTTNGTALNNHLYLDNFHLDEGDFVYLRCRAFSNDTTLSWAVDDNFSFLSVSKPGSGGGGGSSSGGGAAENNSYLKSFVETFTGKLPDAIIVSDDNPRIYDLRSVITTQNPHIIQYFNGQETSNSNKQFSFNDDDSGSLHAGLTITNHTLHPDDSNLQDIINNGRALYFGGGGSSSGGGGGSSSTISAVNQIQENIDNIPLIGDGVQIPDAILVKDQNATTTDGTDHLIQLDFAGWTNVHDTNGDITSQIFAYETNNFVSKRWYIRFNSIDGSYSSDDEDEHVKKEFNSIQEYISNDRALYFGAGGGSSGGSGGVGDNAEVINSSNFGSKIPDVILLHSNGTPDQPRSYHFFGIDNDPTENAILYRSNANQQVSFVNNSAGDFDATLTNTTHVRYAGDTTLQSIIDNGHAIYLGGGGGGGGGSSNYEFCKAFAAAGQTFSHSENGDTKVNLDTNNLTQESQNWLHTDTTLNVVGIKIPEDGLYNINTNLNPSRDPFTQWQQDALNLIGKLNVLKTNGTTELLGHSQEAKTELTSASNAALLTVDFSLDNVHLQQGDFIYMEASAWLMRNKTTQHGIDETLSYISVSKSGSSSSGGGGGGGGGSSTFAGLTDTPSTLAEGSSKYLKVSDDGQTIEYVDLPAGSGGVGSNQFVKDLIETSANGGFTGNVPDAIIVNYKNSVGDDLYGKFELHWVRPNDTQADTAWELIYRMYISGSTADFRVSFKLDADGTPVDGGVLTTSNSEDHDRNLRWFIDNGRAIYYGGGSSTFSASNFQENILQDDITTDNDANFNDLHFTGLEINAYYRLGGQVRMVAGFDANNVNFDFVAYQNSFSTDNIVGSLNSRGTINNYTATFNHIFQATGDLFFTGINLDGSEDRFINGNGTKSTTFLQLEKL